MAFLNLGFLILMVLSARSLINADVPRSSEELDLSVELAMFQHCTVHIVINKVSISMGNKLTLIFSKINIITLTELKV